MPEEETIFEETIIINGVRPEGLRQITVEVYVWEERQDILVIDFYDHLYDLVRIRSTRDESQQLIETLTRAIEIMAPEDNA